MELYLRADKRGPWFDRHGYLDQQAQDLLNEILYRQGFRKIGSHKTGGFADLGQTLGELAAAGFHLQITEEVLQWFEDRLSLQDRNRAWLEETMGEIRRAQRRERDDWDFWPHQVEAAEKLSEETSWILGDDPGLGKTISTLMALPLNAAALVLCPLNAKSTWRREVAAARPDLRAVTLEIGGFRWPEPGELLICHWAALPWKAGESEYLRAIDMVVKRNQKLIEAGWETYGGGRKPCDLCGEPDPLLRSVKDPAIRVHAACRENWEHRLLKNQDLEFPVALEKFVNRIPKRVIFLVLDEAQEVINSKSSRSKRWAAMSEAVVKAGGSRWGLTATPIENREREIFSLLKAFRLHVRCFPEGTDQYMRMAGGRLEDQWHGRTKRVKVWVFEADKDKARALRDPALSDHLAQGILRREAQEVFPDMPAIVRETRTVEGLTAGLAEELLELLNLTHNEDPDIYLEALGQNARFLELRPKMAMLKVPACIGIIQEHLQNSEDPILFCSVHREPVLAVCEFFKALYVIGGVPDHERSRIQDEFQQGRIPVLGFTSGAGALSATYSRAWKLIHIDRDLSWGKNVQAEGRLRAHLQNRSCHIVSLALDCPLERHTSKLLDRKASLVQSIVNPIAQSRNRGVSAREQLQRNLEALWGWQLICGFQNVLRGQQSGAPTLLDMLARELRRPALDAYRGGELSRLYRKLLGGLQLTEAEQLFARQNCSI